MSQITRLILCAAICPLASIAHSQAASSAQPATATSSSVVDISSRAVHTLKIPGSADFLAVADGEAWVTNRGRVEKLKAGTPDPVATVVVARPCGGMEIAFGSVWVVDCRSRALVRINRATAEIEATIPTGVADATGELSIASDAGSIWLMTDTNGVLSRVNPVTNTVIAQIKTQPKSYAVAFGFGSVWLTTTGARADSISGSVQRVDPATNSVVATIATNARPRFLAAGAGGVWTLNQQDGTVSRIDPATNKVAATIQTAAIGGGGDLAAGGGKVWVRGSRLSLAAIDPKSNRVVAEYGPGAGSGAVRVAGNFVWVTALDIEMVWVLSAAKER